MMLGIDRDLHIVAHYAGAAAACRHRATVGIGERDLLVGRSEHLLLVSLKLPHFLFQLRKLLFEPRRLRCKRLRWLLPVGRIELAQIPRHALLKLRTSPLHLRARDVLVAVVARAERQAVGLFALVPAVVDAVRVPVVATGGIADGRGVAAALALGACAVQVGTAFLRCQEAKTHRAWADALARAWPEDTLVSRAFSGRPGRSLATDYALAALSPGAPEAAPYPVQRGLTAAMRAAAQDAADVQRMQAWAGPPRSRAPSPRPTSFADYGKKRAIFCADGLPNSDPVI